MSLHVASTECLSRLFALFAADDFDASLQDGWNQRRGGFSFHLAPSNYGRRRPEELGDQVAGCLMARHIDICATDNAACAVYTWEIKRNPRQMSCHLIPRKTRKSRGKQSSSFDLFSPAWNFFGYLCSAFVGCSSNGKRLWADQEKCEKLKPWPAYYPQKSEENKRKVPWLAARIEVTRMSMSCKTHGHTHTHTHTNIPRLETPKSFSQVSQDGEFIPLRVPPTTSCAAD